jgi:hypothetical protein
MAELVLEGHCIICPDVRKKIRDSQFLSRLVDLLKYAFFIHKGWRVIGNLLGIKTLRTYVECIEIGIVCPPDLFQPR